MMRPGWHYDQVAGGFVGYPPGAEPEVYTAPWQWRLIAWLRRWWRQ
jgi:hypothetical protein